MKCKLLLDENLPPRKKFVRLNTRFNVRHIVHDYHKSGILDSELFKIAEREQRVILTRNEKDFIGNARKKSGLIGISPKLSTEDIDKCINSNLTTHKRCFVIGKFIRVKKKDTKLSFEIV
ncbi:MAG: hypothetical protein UY49_C0039G0010 [Microgenomates group bacterium GW2011_GWC1_49_7]|nr:MAG: hypothetical protein UY49_C0039G0010 [Microgenomates group bacterium GW2011_GWC1_49_7]